MYCVQIWGRVCQNHQGKTIVLFLIEEQSDKFQAGINVICDIFSNQINSSSIGPKMPQNFQPTFDPMLYLTDESKDRTLNLDLKVHPGFDQFPKNEASSYRASPTETISLS